MISAHGTCAPRMLACLHAAAPCTGPRRRAFSLSVAPTGSKYRLQRGRERGERGGGRERQCGSYSRGALTHWYDCSASHWRNENDGPACMLESERGREGEARSLADCLPLLLCQNAGHSFASWPAIRRAGAPSSSLSSITVAAALARVLAHVMPPCGRRSLACRSEAWHCRRPRARLVAVLAVAGWERDTQLM